MKEFILTWYTNWFNLILLSWISNAYQSNLGFSKTRSLSINLDIHHSKVFNNGRINVLPDYNPLQINTNTPTTPNLCNGKIPRFDHINKIMSWGQKKIFLKKIVMYSVSRTSLCWGLGSFLRWCRIFKVMSGSGISIDK